MSSILSPEQAVVELNKHQALLKCAALVVRVDSPIPEIRYAAILLENWAMQFEMLLDEITCYHGLRNNPLCQHKKLTNGNDALEVLLPTSPLGTTELQKLYESRSV